MLSRHCLLISLALLLVVANGRACKGLEDADSLLFTSEHDWSNRNPLSVGLTHEADVSVGTLVRFQSDVPDCERFGLAGPQILEAGSSCCGCCQSHCNALTGTSFLQQNGASKYQRCANCRQASSRCASNCCATKCCQCRSRCCGAESQTPLPVWGPTRHHKSICACDPTPPSRSCDNCCDNPCDYELKKSFPSRVWGKFEDICTAGDPFLVLSGYAFHDRDTWSPGWVDNLNEHAWGGGLGRTLRNKKGNDEMLYLIGTQDSFYNMQFMGGYVHQWIAPVGKKFEAGIGLTASLVSRQDMFDGIPFPAILPVGSVGTRHSKLMVTYVPILGKEPPWGDVWLIFMRFDFAGPR